MAVAHHEREAPGLPLFGRAEVEAAAAPAPAGAPPEPVLDLEDIQGNILSGFNKDFQVLLLLRITDVPACKRWLRSIIPMIATAEEVQAFNQLFKSIRVRRGEGLIVRATWVNIAFSFDALKRLTSDANLFNDQSFKKGLAAQSAGLGDPTGPNDQGNPNHWVVGGRHNQADILLIVAGDTLGETLHGVARVEDTIYGFAPQGKLTSPGVQVIYKQSGAVQPSPNTGHEHFNFLDGVSQPGLRGRVSNAPNDWLTPRQNPNDENQGKPGQDLLWPGEFVFGYPGQDPNKKVEDPGPVKNGGPPWSKNGSFLVYRRLQQDLVGFNTFVLEQAAALGMDPERLGAKFVGRWKSGAPDMRAPQVDNPLMGNVDCANNNFDFQKATPPLPPLPPGAPPTCTDDIPNTNPAQQFDPAPADPTGALCPVAAHIRKSYPRDDTGNESDIQTHRLLRRGIPYGEPSLDDGSTTDDTGLVFLAYMTSIENQFEFVTKNWVNNSNFRDPDTGFDPILGQRAGTNRTRKFTFIDDDGNPQTITIPHDFVIPTGGGYFFSPSICALRHHISS
jgi:Dyp-type peroxidase family